jgi:hypothetical protein
MEKLNQASQKSSQKGLRLDGLRNPVAEIHSAESSAAVIALVIFIII